MDDSDDSDDTDITDMSDEVEIIEPPSGSKNNSVKDGSVTSKDQENMDENSDSSVEDLASAEDDDDVSDREFKTMNSVILSLQVLAICI